MKKIGNYWVPDIDAAQGYNLERTKAAYEHGEGIQIHHLREALGLIKGNGVAIDGGANVGSWTKALAARFSLVHAFEPFHVAFQCLQRNISDWNFGDDKVKLHEAALSNRFGGVDVAPVAEGKRTVTCGVTGEGEIPAMTIDSLGLSSCDFIKLDIEGYEPQALQGAEATIKRHSPWIMIENRRAKSGWFQRRTPAEIILKRLGYEVVAKYGDSELDWLFEKKQRPWRCTNDD